MKGKPRLMIFGSSGLVGSACTDYFLNQPQFEVVSVTRKDLDLTQSDAVSRFIQRLKPECIILAAAKVGGILVNSQKPVEFFSENMSIQLNVLQAAYRANVDRLVFLGSSCIYPSESETPIHEEALLTGRLETTNEAYALAKISGLKLCQYYNEQYDMDFRVLMPTNLYGDRDNFSSDFGHVIPGLIRRIHDAKIHNLSEVEIWGSGLPIREFLYSEDLSEAIGLICSLAKKDFFAATGPPGFLNVGSGSEISIRELAELIVQIIGYKGRLSFNQSMPDGVLRKTLDSSKIRKLGWSPRISLEDGLRRVYQAFQKMPPDN